MKKLHLVQTILCFALFFFCASSSFADVSFSYANSSVKACDEFSTTQLNNPWDMSDSADINNYFAGIDVNGWTNPGISSGIFQGTTGNTASLFYMFSPVPCGAYPVGGRWGQNLSLDVSKYTHLTVRMYTNKPDNVGIRLIWDRSCNYASNRSLTTVGSVPTKVGWHTYTIDLNAIGIDPATNTAGWNVGFITGLGIIPTAQSGALVQVDSVRLEQPSSCSGLSTSIGFTPTADGGDAFYSLYMVNAANPNPFTHGFERQFRTSQSADGNPTSVTLTDVVGITPGQYKVVGVVDSDYATLERTDPWDFNDEGDVLLTSGISGATFSGGVYSGTASPGAIMYLRLSSDNINGSKYRYVSVKGSFTGGSPSVFPLGALSLVGGVYQGDLGSVGGWVGGSFSQFAVQIPAGSFSIDFVSLRASGYDTVRDSASVDVDVSSNIITVNQPPLIEIESPTHKGGEAIRPWNMNSGDLSIMANLTNGVEPSIPTETLTTYLPDVRVVDGLRGDFFKGTSLQGSDDPTNYSTFPTGAFNNFKFASGDYRNLCFKLLIAKPFDLGGGSVARVIWKKDGGSFFGSEDLVLITDGWSGTTWYEYCMDMPDVHLDGQGIGGWDGIIDGFRVDPHEFSFQTSYYFDYIKLRGDAKASDVFNIVYKVSDPEDANVTVKFYYSTSKTSYNPANLIGTVSSADQTRVFPWNVAGVPGGSYYIHATADDGVNPVVTRYGTGRVVIDGVTGQGTAPVLAVESPADNAVVCSSMQFKGYALQTDRLEDVAVVEIKVDGNLFARVHPSVFSPNAKALYPTMDSSNAGFNTAFDASGLSLGTHTVTITAHSRRGPSTTVTRSIVKASTGCTAFVVDPDPAGVPVTVDVGGGGGPAPAPTPTNTARVKAAKHDSKAFTVQISNLASDNVGCTLALYGRAKKTDAPTALGSGVVSASHAKKKVMNFSQKKVKAKNDKKMPKSVLLSSQLVCSGVGLTESSMKKVNLSRGSAGAKTPAALFKTLKKLKAAK